MKVTLQDITKEFEETTAVDDVNIDAKDGDFLVLLGPSGCGKTTTLRIVAGLETPDEGEVQMGGEIVTDTPPKDRDVAMVFQTYAIYPYMKVAENIAFPLKMRDYDDEKIEEKVKETAELLQIEDLLDRDPEKLSGGQRQRVALARAIIRDPNVFLMDEPLSNLDAKLRIGMRKELKRLHRELGVTTIYVTHDQEEAMSLGKRVAVMNEGRLHQIGEPEEIYDNPNDKFVGKFLGSPSMNQWEGEIKEKDGDKLVETDFFEYSLSEKWDSLVSEGDKVIIGVRPEDILINEKGSDNLNGEIDVVELMERKYLVTITIQDGTIKAIVPRAKEPEVGNEVDIKFREDRIYLFDAESELGENIELKESNSS